MRKRIISVAIVIAVFLGLFVNCNIANSSATPELNIVDDNYRNYYEVFVYSFCDSDGDKIGDLNGVTHKLDYIQDMGFNGIWLMPVMPSTTYHKYDVTDYCAIDKDYGTLDDFKTLVEECHKRGIRLIIDFVMNHTSSEHEWFTKACDYLRTLKEGEDANAEDCKYVDYYHFSKEQVDGTYYKVVGSEYYYEGSFWEEMPDLNMMNSDVRAEFEKISKFWIDLGVDGFRMDAAMHYEEGSTEKNSEILNWLYTYCTSLNPDFYMVSEVWANKSTIADYYASETPSMFNFDTSSAEGCIARTAMGTYSAQRFVECMLQYQEDYSSENKNYIDAPFLTNHDQVRIANNLQGNITNMKMAAGLLMMMNGSPFVYYGEEIGMESQGQEDENKRLPMRWSDEDTTGMTNGPEGCKNDIEYTIGAEDKQIDDEESLLNYYKRAILLRNQNPEIARGEIEIVDSLTADEQAVITKTYDGSTIAIVYNTGDEAADIDLSKTALEGMKICGTLTISPKEEIDMDGNTIKMPAKSIAILK